MKIQSTDVMKQKGKALREYRMTCLVSMVPLRNLRLINWHHNAHYFLLKTLFIYFPSNSSLL